MALRAGDANAEEVLGDRARHLVRLGDRLVEVRRRDLVEAPLGEHDLTDELIERLVGGEAARQPAIVRLGPLGSERLAIDAQDIPPEKGLCVGIFGPVEKLVDEPRSFVCALVGEERLRLRQRRQRADHIEIDASQERRIVRHRRRQQVQLAQPGVDVLVDQGRFVERGERNLVRPRYESPEGDDVVEIARHDGDFAGYVAGRDDACLVHGRHAVVVRLELRPGGDVGLVAVGEASGNAERLRRVHRHLAFGRLDLQEDDARRRRVAERSGAARRQASSRSISSIPSSRPCSREPPHRAASSRTLSARGGCFRRPRTGRVGPEIP